MHGSSLKRRSSSNPVRISIIDREDKSLTGRPDRRTQTLKSKKISIGESSHIPRPRFRSSSCDRAGSLGRKSCLKVTGKTPLKATTPITPSRSSNRLLPNIVLTASTSRHHAQLAAGRSPSGERNVGAKGPRKDTRPLGDKMYQIDLLHKIDSYFNLIQCSIMLNSNHSLKPITLKMFVEVSGFLLQNFIIKHELTTTNYIEELPKYAKKLHYPGVINKSWLKTANAMHSWPYVLGWIGWLVEICQVKESALNIYQIETLPFIGSDQQSQSLSLELQALLESYTAWNDEKLEEEAEILQQYLDKILIHQGVTEEDMNQAHREMEEEEIKLQMHEEESQNLDETIKHLQQKIASLQTKESQKLNDIKTMDNDINKLSAETNQLEAEYVALNKQIQIGNSDYEKLIRTVKHQPVSKSVIKNIDKQCIEVQNYIHQFDEHLKDYEKELYILDLKFANVNSDLNKAILSYNKQVFMHIDNDVGLNFDELKLPEKEFLNPQMIEEMKERASLIIMFKDKLKNQNDEVESLIHSNTIQLKEMQEKVKSSLDENKLTEEMNYVNEKRENAKKEKAKLTKQIESLRSEIKEMQSTLPDIQAADLELEEAQDKLDAVERRKLFLEQAAKRFFAEFYKVIGEHRQELHNILEKDGTK
ncbi:hypothetical protein PUN28_016087 [Cardiocondyla obscurior]|uniref:Kinetochore protein NDC80 n=1 Tax=Cardiocondyla obscurior TaxID=286306 RepID=A0AAW2EUI9_9HYME